MELTKVLSFGCMIKAPFIEEASLFEDGDETQTKAPDKLLNSEFRICYSRLLLSDAEYLQDNS